MVNLKRLNEVKVFYAERQVGTLVESPAGEVGWRYTPDWLAKGFSISPFSLPLKDQVFIDPRRDFEGLYGVFAGSLPGGWGCLVRDRYLLNEGIDPLTLGPLTKLSLLDEDALGGLAYRPSSPRFSFSGTVDLDLLKKQANALLDGKEEKDLALLRFLGGSSGGARPKINLHEGGELWIVKFPCRYDVKGIAKEEMDYNDCAASLGINVPPHRLFKGKEETFFGVKRFDREKGKRIHMISLAELLETPIDRPFLDYGHLFKCVQAFGGDSEEMMRVFSIMCFNFFAHNYDDHGNNFSFLYSEEKKRYVLSPFYDLTGPQLAKEHEMMINGKGRPVLTDLFALASLFGLEEKACKRRAEEIEKAVHRQLGRYLIY